MRLIQNELCDIAAEKPEGVPEQNWRPTNRGDEAVDLMMCIYAPDVERMKTWQAPKAEKIAVKLFKGRTGWKQKERG